MARVYETVSGQRIEYPEPDARLAKFIKEAELAAADVKVAEDALVALLFGRENPILDQTFFPERGAVTKEVLENPVYAVLSDLLVRKRLQKDGVDPKKLGSKYTLTVGDAAKRKGVSEDAIRKAIRERRLPAWVREGVTYLEQKTLDAVQLGGRGPLPKGGDEPLVFQVGYDKGHEASFKLVVDGKAQPAQVEVDPSKPVNQTHTVHCGRVERWRRAVVFTGAGGHARFFELVPSTEEPPERLELYGFFVKGRFSIIRKENNPKKAREAWEASRASQPASH
jgi:hypothetical protein